MKKNRSVLKNTVITFSVLAVCFALSVVLQDILEIDEHVTTVFVFAVFVISLVTDSCVYGIIATMISVLAVNFAFTFPYFSFNFTMPENLLSAIVMLAVSLMTSTLISRTKKWEALKKEGELETMRANLLRAVSHDLRTPITTVYGSSSAILENYRAISEEQKLKLIKGIKEDAEWLIRMVENLLSVTKLDGGALKLIKTPAVLDELIDSVYSKFQKRYPDQKIKFDLPDDIVIIPMDAILIEQVIINILENSVLHAKGMTEISLKVYTLSDKAVFEISDNGEGIEKDILPNIFTGHISSVKSASDGKKRNAGIGLSVCSSIIKAHGGEIFAENIPGGGALFRFALSLSLSAAFSGEGETSEQQ